MVLLPLLAWQDYYPPPTQSPAQLPPGFSTPRLFSDLTALRVSMKTPNRRPGFPRITSTETVRNVRTDLKLRLCESENGAKALSPGRSRPTNLPLILRSNCFSDSFRKGSSRKIRISHPRRYPAQVYGIAGVCGSVPEYYA